MDRRNRKMDPTERKITKIAREAGKFTVQAMKEEGIGTAEFDFIHLVRHHPGITQTEVREQLKIDKGAAARRAPKKCSFNEIIFHIPGTHCYIHFTFRSTKLCMSCKISSVTIHGKTHC